MGHTIISILDCRTIQIEILKIENWSETKEDDCFDAQRIIVRRETLTCKNCDYVIHSDQAGSRNILKFNKPGVSWDGANAVPKSSVRYWNNHEWIVKNPYGLGTNVLRIHRPSGR